MKRTFYRGFRGKFRPKPSIYERMFSGVLFAGVTGLTLGLYLVSPIRPVETQVYAEEVVEQPIAGQTLPSPTPSPSPEPVISEDLNIDLWTGEAINKFFNHPQQRSEARMIMHCLLHRESAHGYNQGHGDNGNAGGILQYWEGTWTGFRKEMITAGYADDISSRYNTKDAIFTTVWALRNNRGQNWGPIYRELTNYIYSDLPGCPVPSWSKGAK